MKKKLLLPFTCITTSIASLSPLSILSSCGNHEYDKIANELYKSTITEFVGSNTAKTLIPDTYDGVAGVTSVARPTGHLNNIRNYLKTRIKELGLTDEDIHENTNVDEQYRSLWFDIPASAGNENKSPVILQGHMDLVFAFDEEAFKRTYPGEPLPEKTQWNPHAVIDKKTNSIHTENYCTTLGADNGSGISQMLAILKNKDLEGFNHGPIRCILTADEEDGMKGADALVCGEFMTEEFIPQPAVELAKIFNTPYMVNIDAETLGEMVTSNAGGIGCYYNQKYKRVRTNLIGPTYKQFTIKISGLKGGHSGADINFWHANAVKMASQILYFCDLNGIILTGMETPGTTAYNSIPSSCIFSFAAPDTLQQIQDACTYVFNDTLKVYKNHTVLHNKKLLKIWKNQF